MEEQLSQEWFAIRNGKFTASKIDLLLGVKGLGKTGETYCFEKAVELVEGEQEETYTNFDMQRGIEQEPYAFNKFSELMSLEFKSVSKAEFVLYGEHAGASPDGLVSDNSILEIKCPKRAKFYRYLIEGVKAIDDVYYNQMQMQMLATNCNQAYFFNYIIIKGVEKWHTIVVPRDEDRIELIKSRIEEAIVKRDEYVKTIINNKQF